MSKNRARPEPLHNVVLRAWYKTGGGGVNGFFSV